MPKSSTHSSKSSTSELITAEEFKTCFLKVLESEDIIQLMINKLNAQLSMVIEEKVKKVETALSSKIQEQNKKN